MLGFGGHFLTKSRAYSTTFGVIRQERRIWRLRADLDQLAADTDNHGADVGPVDLMCRDEDDGWIAVEIKRVATIDAVEQLHRYRDRYKRDMARRASASRR